MQWDLFFISLYRYFQGAWGRSFPKYQYAAASKVGLLKKQGGRDYRGAKAGQHDAAVSEPRTSWRVCTASQSVPLLVLLVSKVHKPANASSHLKSTYGSMLKNSISQTVRSAPYI